MIPITPTTFDEFRTFYLANAACDDGTEEFANSMREIEDQFPEWFAQLTGSR